MVIEKIKKIGIIVLCVTLFLSAISLTLSLIPKDKTTSPPLPPPPEPIYQKEFKTESDFNGIAGAMAFGDVRFEDNGSDIATFYCTDLEVDGGSIWFQVDPSNFPVTGKKVVVEGELTLYTETYESFDFLISGNYYPIFNSVNTQIGMGKHTFRYEYDNLGIFYDEEGNEDDTQSILSIYLDGRLIHHFEGSVNGGCVTSGHFEGIGFTFTAGNDLSFIYEIGDEIFTLHSLTMKIY